MNAPRPARVPRPVGVWVAGVVAVAIALAAGVALSKTLASSLQPDAATAPREVTAEPATVGALRFEPDPDWARVSRIPEVPGFPKDGSVAFAPHPGLSTVVIATVRPIEDGTLLPAALRKGAPRPSKGRLAGLRAWYYRGLAAGRWRLDTAVLPTSRGVVTVACAAPESAGEIPLGCLEAVRGVGVADADTLEPSRVVGLVARLPSVMKRLDAARVQGRTALRRGDTPRAQQRAAADLRRAHEAAAERLTPVAEARSAQSLVAALRDTAGAYHALERAAARRDRRAWTQARTRVARAEQSLRRAFAKVGAASARAGADE